MGLFSKKEKTYSVEFTHNEMEIVGVAMAVYLGNVVSKEDFSKKTVRVILDTIGKINVPLADMAKNDVHGDCWVDINEVHEAQKIVNSKLFNRE